jgi:hypothetical protein
MNTIIDFQSRKTVNISFLEVEKGKKLMNIARKKGSVKIGRGVFLYSNKVLIENQKTLPNGDLGKNTDYTVAPFWILVKRTATGNTVSPCRTPQEVIEIADKDLIEAFIF